MRIFLADAEPEVRSALCTILNQEPDVRIVGEASRAHRLLDRVQATQPDLVLLDWELPGEPVAALLPALRGTNGRSRVIALSVRPDVEQAALAAGADAFVSKTDPPERLLVALHECFDRTLPNNNRHPNQEKVEDTPGQHPGTNAIKRDAI
jgi:DNA-binding NarL/FixJ family response regulator